jgi:hypothetical protein
MRNNPFDPNVRERDEYIHDIFSLECRTVQMQAQLYPYGLQFAFSKFSIRFFQM